MKNISIILNKCLHYFLALQIINLSFANLATEEKLISRSGNETNAIDSALEFITEHVLGWNNFIPEKHKARQDAHFLKVNTCYFYCERQKSAAPSFARQTNLRHAEFIPGSLSEYEQEITPPPPKFS